MRLKEFANAQDQLALLRIIIDNTWRAVEQQAREQAAQQAQAAKSNPAKPKRKATASNANALPIPKPKANKAKAAAKPAVTTNAPTAVTAPKQALSAVKPKPPSTVGTAAAQDVYAQPGSAA